MEGMEGCWIEKFSVGTNPSASSLTQESDQEIADRFGRGDLLKPGHAVGVVSYTIRMTPGMVHLAEAVIIDGRGDEPRRETRTVLVMATTEPSELPTVVDISRGGTLVKVFVPLPGARGDWTALALTAKSPASGIPVAQSAVVLDPVDTTIALALIGPPLRPGHNYLIDVTLVDPAGVATRLVRDRPVTLQRRVVTIQLEQVVVFDDLDAMTSGDFKLFARIIGKLSGPDRDVEHAFAGSTHEFKLDSSNQPNKLNGSTTHKLPVFPDSQSFQIADGPAIVDDDREQVWLTLVASENDEFETERAYGSVRLYIPNTNATDQFTFEAMYDRPIEHWNADDPVQPPPPGLSNGVELWTAPLEDPKVHALTIRGKYSVEYKS
jgi:hypothetical protein